MSKPRDDRDGPFTEAEIIAALKANQGNVLAAARQLGCNSRLINKLRSPEVAAVIAQERRKAGRLKGFSEAEVIKTVESAKGVVADAARQLGCTERCLHFYVTHHPAVAEAIKKQRELARLALEAEQAAYLASAKDAGKLLNHDNPTLGQLVALYRGYVMKNTRTEASQESQRLLDLFLRERLPDGTFYRDIEVKHLRPYHLELWVNSRPSVRSDWTRRRWIVTIQRPLNWAARLRMIDQNPFRGVRLKQGDSFRPMRADEFGLLLRKTSADFRRVLIFLRFTGCRPKELCDTEWSFVDFDKRVIVLRRHKTEKTRKDKRPRTIVLHPVVLKLLFFLKRQQVAAGTDSSFVFVNRFGKRNAPKDLSKRLLHLRDKHKIDPACKLYGLRHAYGSRAVLNGVNLASLKVLMGHTRLATTERYIHVEEQTAHLAEAVEAASRQKGNIV